LRGGFPTFWKTPDGIAIVEANVIVFVVVAIVVIIVVNIDTITIVIIVDNIVAIIIVIGIAVQFIDNVGIIDVNMGITNIAHAMIVCHDGTIVGNVVVDVIVIDTEIAEYICQQWRTGLQHNIGIGIGRIMTGNSRNSNTIEIDQAIQIGIDIGIGDVVVVVVVVVVIVIVIVMVKVDGTTSRNSIAWVGR
jgi:hypothetical protein